ncbi:hypothetical protein [Aliarcobacter skirrowii]|uniref:hypothetical protein n=1 Tax=Aliarcobacter skirrowii TaxID=28200 RepID=UPI0008245076|nr:hypothetical protein [Aliarcobacter skirrowii]
MSKTKRLEKEIDYLKFLIGGLIAVIAAIISWIVNGTLIMDSILLQISIGLFLFALVCGIIYLHIKVQNTLNKLEAEND